MDAFFQYGRHHTAVLLWVLDRFGCLLLGGQETHQDFIAFPKNNSGRDVMIRCRPAFY